MGGGPVILEVPHNPVAADRLIQLAEKIKFLPTCCDCRATPNDANVMQVHGGGVATGLVAIPNRYMHSAVEVISTDDLDAAADLLAMFAESVGPSDDFTLRP